MSTTSLLSTLKNVFDHHLSKNVTFRNLARCDAFPLFSATQNEAFNRFLLWPAPPTAQDIMPQVDKLVREHTMGRALVLSLCDKTTGIWHGLILIKPFRDGLEMGLGLHPKVWNRGVVFTAGQSVIEIIMKHIPDAVIYNRVRPGNARMERICHHYGFELIDRVQEQHASGSLVDLDVYRLNRDLWKGYSSVSSY